CPWPVIGSSLWKGGERHDRMLHRNDRITRGIIERCTLEQDTRPRRADSIVRLTAESEVVDYTSAWKESRSHDETCDTASSARVWSPGEGVDARGPGEAASPRSRRAAAGGAARQLYRSCQ